MNGANADEYKQALDVWIGSEEVRARWVDQLDGPGKRAFARLRAQLKHWHLSGEITSFGIGPKFVQGWPTEERALRIYLARKRPLRQLTRGARIPERLDIPGFDQVLNLDVIQLPGPKHDGLTGPQDPVFPGVSVGHARSGLTGSIGAFCRLAGEGTYLLSAAHVIAASGAARRNDVIIQPGTDHGGQVSRNQIGNLAEFERFIGGSGYLNKGDVALAKLKEHVAVSREFGSANGFARREDILENRTRVIRFGCMSGRRSGTVTDLHYMGTMCYSVPGFQDTCFGFSELLMYDAFSIEGDSGGPVLTEDGRLLGIHLGRAGSMALATPIWNIVNRWNIELM